MDGLKVTYRGIEVPDRYHANLDTQEFGHWKAGVDATLDAIEAGNDAACDAVREAEAELLGGPKAPRQWFCTEDIPADVQKVKTARGAETVAQRTHNGRGWQYIADEAGQYSHNGWDQFDEDELPVTEVTE